jgi:hypothetical protein
MRQSKFNLKPNKDKTIIGDEWTDSDSPLDYICSWCQCDLVRLSSGNNSESWFCRRCSIEYPDKSETRKKSKLGTQRNEIEPAITSTGTVPDVSIKKEVELKGGFAALAKKGTIRFTSYNTTEKQ